MEIKIKSSHKPVNRSTKSDTSLLRLLTHNICKDVTRQTHRGDFAVHYVLFTANRLNRSCWLPIGGTAVLRGGALLLLLLKWDKSICMQMLTHTLCSLHPSFCQTVTRGPCREDHINTLWVQTKSTRYHTVGYGDDLNSLQHMWSGEIFHCCS